MVTQEELNRLQALASVENRSLSATVHKLVMAGLDSADAITSPKN